MSEKLTWPQWKTLIVLAQMDYRMRRVRDDDIRELGLTKSARALARRGLARRKVEIENRQVRRGIWRITAKGRALYVRDVRREAPHA